MHNAISLHSPDGTYSIPLVSIAIEGTQHNLMADITVEQTFKNVEPRSIEAVYTFPLPHNAVLMGLHVILGERTLQGIVEAASEADERYETAISEGDGAVLLQKISGDDNLYTMNVGNIRPNETVIIRFSYALLTQLQDNQLRLSIPTTVSPRYGNPHKAGIAPHQIPETDLIVEHRYSLCLTVTGLFQSGAIDSPTHKIDVENKASETVITLNGEINLLDRDFVLRLQPGQSISSSVTADRDTEGYCVMATFLPILPDCDRSPHDIRIVIDCSGSMNGDSIKQAASALKTMLDELRPLDVFNIILFGSTHLLLFPEPVIASKNNIARARKLARGLTASMGGTEMGGAMEVTSGMPCSVSDCADILLITDGQVYEHSSIIDDIKEYGHRVFSVGVGSSVTESFIRNIGEQTNGAAEFVTPNEGMAKHIVRHFHRIYSPQAKATLTWPQRIVDQKPEHLPVVYSGDTLHVFGHSDTIPEGNVTLELKIHDTTIVQRASITVLDNPGVIPSTLARLAADQSLEMLEEEAQIDTAVRYQLMTDKTSYIVIDQRVSDEKTNGAPAIRKVAQMLPAGWGGISSPSVSCCYENPSERPPSGSISGSATDCLDIPAFLRRSGQETNYAHAIRSPWDAFCTEITNLLNENSYDDLDLNGLVELGIPNWIIALLGGLRSADLNEHEIVHTFLYRLISLRLKTQVDKQVFQALKARHPHIPEGLSGVMTSLVKAAQSDMDQSLGIHQIERDSDTSLHA